MSASIMTRAVTLAFGTALALRVVLGTVPADATTFPVVAPGDPISGLFTLDPNTPVILGSGSITGQFFDYLDPGTMAIALGGQIFAAQISAAFVELPPLATQALWEATTGPDGTVNGEAVHLLVMTLYRFHS